MPYIIKNKCVYKKTAKGGKGKKKGCSKSEEMAKRHLKKLYMVGEILEDEIETYFQLLGETPRDKKLLKKINMQKIRNSTPKEEEESWEEYNQRLDEPSEDGPDYDQGILKFLGEMPDSAFPSKARKIFTIWLGNALRFAGTDLYSSGYNSENQIKNDLDHIRDYINGAGNEIPKEVWSMRFDEMVSASRDWHNELAQRAAEGDIPDDFKHLQYITQNVVHKFGDGYTIVTVPTEPTREYTKEEGLRCYWAHNQEELEEFKEYYHSKGKTPPNFTIKDQISDLDIEGCVMGHCVAGYCDSVSSGESVIYSLRSPDGRAHATIEYGFNSMVSSWAVIQIKGKQNALPNEKYRPKVKNWLNLKFDIREYINCEDYAGILTADEQISLINSDDETVKKHKRYIKHSLARTYTTQEEVLEEMLKDENVDKSVIQSMTDNRTLSSKIIKKIITLDLENGFSSDDNLSDDVIRKLFEIGKPEWHDFAAAAVEDKIKASEELKQSPEFYKEIWEEILEPHLNQHFFKNASSILQVIAEKDHIHPSIKEKILNRAFEDDSIQEAMRESVMRHGQRHEAERDDFTSDWSTGFEKIVYSLAESNISRRSLDAIYRFSKSEEGRQLVPWTESHLARNQNIPDFIVDEMLDNPKLGNSKFISLITNIGVADDKKIDIVHIVASRGGRSPYTIGQAVWEPHTNPADVSDVSTVIKIFTRRIMDVLDAQDNLNDNKQKVYGPKFVKWILNSGMIDWWLWGRFGHIRSVNLRKEAIYEKHGKESVSESLFQEIRDYFKSPEVVDKDDRAGKFDYHPQATLEKLMDPDEFAPWD